MSSSPSAVQSGFADLHLDPRIVEAVHRYGYTQPTVIQQRSIPLILNGQDVVASSKTGTGKTAAFVLPALHQLSLTPRKSEAPRVLVLTPTRELATQIAHMVGQYGHFMKLFTAILVGGAPYGPQIRDLRKGVDLIIATPGRLMDHMDEGRVDLSKIDMFILDEADRMLDMGFIEDIEKISQKIPSKRQTILFSATMADRMSEIIKELLNNPARVNLTEDKTPPAQITQKLYFADSPEHKKDLLEHYLKQEAIFKGIIFSATKAHADVLSHQLNQWGFRTAPLHGDLNQNKRTRTIEQLRRGKIQLVVATDVASRGIDVPDISHVINYDLPKFSEDYVHRIGRTGRAGKKGTAISFALPGDVRLLAKIERFTKQKIEADVISGLEPKKQFHSKPQQRSAPARAGNKTGKRFFEEDTAFKRPFKKKPFAGSASASFERDSRDGDKGGFYSKKPQSRHAHPQGKTGRPFGQSVGDRPFSERSERNRPTSDRPFSDRPFSDRSERSRPAGDRPERGRFASKGGRSQESTAGGFRSRNKGFDAPQSNGGRPNGRPGSRPGGSRPFKKTERHDRGGRH